MCYHKNVSEILDQLNSEQQAALLQTEGAVLVTAGAGSGKTKLLTNRIAFLIKEKADLNRVDRLIVPYDSNFLLGVEVSKRLGKPMVKMRFERGKIITAQPWEGQLNPTDRVIIIHDVLVKADQIIHTLEQLPRTCEVLGVYCLITRKEWKGLERLEQKGVTVEQIVCLNDNDISTIREEK